MKKWELPLEGGGFVYFVFPHVWKKAFEIEQNKADYLALMYGQTTIVSISLGANIYLLIISFTKMQQKYTTCKPELILIHGWDPQRYSRYCIGCSGDTAWDERKTFVDGLSMFYNVHFFNLPGFCGVPEPSSHLWSVEDFANALNQWISARAMKPAVVLGYSFGGAIALTWKQSHPSDTIIILVSPALVRATTARTALTKFMKIFFCTSDDRVKQFFRHWYLCLVNKYYRSGSLFLRNTYDRIVRLDLRWMLYQVPPSQVLLIYGECDTATPWKMVEHDATTAKITSVLIKGGTHSIGKTHPQQIVDVITVFTNAR